MLDADVDHVVASFGKALRDAGNALAQAPAVLHA
jgi:hypothetical protein